MKQLGRTDIIDILSPEALSYLFPGMPETEGQPVLDAEIPGAPASDAMYDMAYGEMPGIREDRLQRKEREPAKERKSIFNWHKPVGTECRKATEPDAEIAEPDAEALDPRTEQILAEIRRLQEKYGVSIDELEVMLGYTVKLSPIRITRSGKIFLSEYEYKEVKMPNVAKALYFLYLRHPEGLRYKEIADHKDELLQIYGNISGRDIPEEIEKSIALLVDPYGNALNVNASRIKTAFRNVVSDRIARFYYISGAAGDAKKVPLDRDLVLWDH